MWALQRSAMYRDMATVGVDVVSWRADRTLEQSMGVLPDRAAGCGDGGDNNVIRCAIRGPALAMAFGLLMVGLAADGSTDRRWSLGWRR